MQPPTKESRLEEPRQGMSNPKPTSVQQEDPREWLLFDIEDEDPIAAEFIKPPSQSATPVLPPLFSLL